MESSLHLNEEGKRAETLLQLQYLESESDQDFNDIAVLASLISNAPISFVALAAADRMYVKSVYGIEPQKAVDAEEFCLFTIQQRDIFVVHDARQNEQFLSNPLVVANVPFYAGIPLIMDENPIGTLCIMDYNPRELTEKQGQGMRLLATQLVGLLKLRLQNRKHKGKNNTTRANETEALESEYAFSAYFNNAKDAILLIAPDHTLKAFNKLAETNTRVFLHQQLQVGKSMLDYAQEDRKKHYKEKFEKALSGEETHVEALIAHGTGYVWWQITYLPVRAHKSEEIIGVILKMENIDHRKKIEEDLKENKQLITDITDNVPNGVVFQYILSADEQTHSFRYVSSGTSKLFGYAPDDIVKDAKLVFDLIYPDSSRLIEAIHHSKDNMVDFDLQYQILVEGNLKWAHTKSTPKRLSNGSVQWDGLTIDITEQKEAYELVERTKQDLQAIVSTIPDLLFRIDSENRFVFYHAGDPNDLYILPESFLGKQLEQVIPPQLMQRLVPYLRKARSSNEIVVFEYDLDIPNRGMNWFEARMVNIEQGELMIMIRNVTERRNTEIALHESEANLHTVFNNTDVGYFLLNAELKLLSFNKPAFAFTKDIYHKELKVGSFYFDYFQPKDHAMLKETLNTVLSGKVVQYDRNHLIDNGRDNWFFVKYSPISNKNDQVIGIVMNGRKHYRQERSRTGAE